MHWSTLCDGLGVMPPSLVILSKARQQSHHKDCSSVWYIAANTMGPKRHADTQVYAVLFVLPLEQAADLKTAAAASTVVEAL